MKSALKTIKLIKTCRAAASPHLIYKSCARRCSAILVAIGFAGILLASCGDSTPSYKFKTAKQGITCYGQYLSYCRTNTHADMATICKDINTWLEIEDSVESIILRDTTKYPHLFPEDDVHRLHNSVRDEIMNRVISKPRSLQELALLKTETNRMSRDPKIVAAVKTAAPFFESLDSVNLYNDDCATLLGRYQRFLGCTEKAGIHSKAQLTSFMREEDRLFRSFVLHLHEMDGMSATDITQSTERIYAQLAKSAADASISQDELMIYLTMRTNRRLLVNAQACLTDSKSGKVKSPDQRKAYLWMILQPFTAMGEFHLAMLTEQQKSAFMAVAKDASSQLPRLAANDKEMRQNIERIPDLLIKMYISSL